MPPVELTQLAALLQLPLVPRPVQVKVVGVTRLSSGSRLNRRGYFRTVVRVG